MTDAVDECKSRAISLSATERLAEVRETELFLLLVADSRTGVA